MGIVTNTILFVCIENTFRSVMSEAIFNSRAPPGWQAKSAGVNPANAMNPDVAALLAELGINFQLRTPKVVTPDDIAEARRVITFGCLDRCPIGAAEKGEDWPIPGAAGKSFEQLREIRNEISRRIDDLMTRLPRNKEVEIV